MLPFLGDDPAENVFVDLKIAIDLRQGFRLDQELHLPHHGLHASKSDLRCRQPPDNDAL